MSLTKKESRFPSLLPVIGILVLILAFVGFLLFAYFVNPPATPIAVAVVDIPAGTVIMRDMVGIDEQRINAQVASVLVQERDLDQFIGGIAVQNIYAFEPVAKADISTRDNPAASSRLSLALTDPTIVAIVIPVTRETAPNKIVAGDYVDLNFAVGSAMFLAGSLSTAPTPFPFQPLPGVFVTQPSLPLPATPTPTAEPRLTLPVAKTIVHAARVLSVVYDEAPNPAYAGPGSGEPATIRGDLVAIVVTVPAEAQELVQFGVTNGAVRVSLLAPGKDWESDTAGPRQPTLGMSWDDFVALMRLDRASALATKFPDEIVGPGAFAVEATLNARTQSGNQFALSTNTALAFTATPGPTATATP